MNDLIFDAPWWLWAVPAAVGVLLLVMGNSRQSKNLLKIGGAGVLVAVLIFALSWLVETPKEKAISGSRALARQVAAADWPGVKSHLAAKAKLIVGEETVFKSADEILASARLAHEQFHLLSIGILSLEPPASSASPMIVTVKVLSQHDLPAIRSIVSTWSLEWEDGPDGVRLERIRAMEISGQPASGIRGRIPGG